MASTALAQPQTVPATPPAGPQLTYVGLDINDIYQLDLKQSTYTADFYVWLRWHGDADPTNIEFLNGSLDLKEHPNPIETPATKYVSYHCRGTFHTTFDYRRYPLDEHILTIEMEDGNDESDKLKYVIDRENLKQLTAPTLAGWTCEAPQFDIQDHLYQTDFGDPTQPADSATAYSRLVCSIRISRHSFSIYMKTFLALFISVAIAFLSFVLKPHETDPRFGVGIAAIFGAVSSQIVTTSNLPDMPYLTLADKIHVFSLFMIFLSLLQSCLALRLVRDQNVRKIRLAARIDRISLFAFPMSYAAVVAGMTFIH